MFFEKRKAFEILENLLYILFIVETGIVMGQNQDFQEGCDTSSVTRVEPRN